MTAPVFGIGAAQAAQRHVMEAQRFEFALARKLETGLFGDRAAGRPWPEHDAALCADSKRIADQAWLRAAILLLEIFGPR